LLVLGIALSLCGLTDKLKSNSGNSNKASPTASDNDDSAEPPEPTSAQTAAISGGPTVS